jgi:predicted component of type VI protein secretion system
MPAQLVALSEGSNILLDKPILLLGRHPECDIQIDSRKISRRHCCIAQVEDHLMVRDLGSTNGIRINGVRVQEGRLAPNDELTIGNSRYRVCWDVVAAASEPANLKERQEPVRGTHADVLDDDVLESCEEPVALDEEDVSPLRGVPVRRHTEAHPNDSIILPDNLELAPLSGDAIPPPPPPH